MRDAELLAIRGGSLTVGSSSPRCFNDRAAQGWSTAAERWFAGGYAAVQVTGLRPERAGTRHLVLVQTDSGMGILWRCFASGTEGEARQRLRAVGAVLGQLLAG